MSKGRKKSRNKRGLPCRKYKGERSYTFARGVEKFTVENIVLSSYVSSLTGLGIIDVYARKNFLLTLSTFAVSSTLIVGGRRGWFG
jgi:hypothetical protein